MSKESSNKRNAPEGDRQVDLFAPSITDLRLRDQRNVMEHAFLSLSKRPRKTPIEYRNADGSVWVKVDPHQNYGMANIYDWDVIIWVSSQIRAAMDRGEDPPRTLDFHPYNLLKSIRRGHGKTEYDKLRKTFDRLASTYIKTSIRRRGKEKRQSFTWLDEWKELIDDEGKPTHWRLTLCQWLWEGIVDERLILAVDPDYFLLTGGTERWLYRVARKHAGRQASGYSLRMKRLYKKSGSTGTKRKFAFRMRKIVERDELPEYTLELHTEEETGEERVWMCRRSLLPEADPRWEPPTWNEQKYLEG